MTDMNQNYEMPSDVKQGLPTGINVLTILTFIGCGTGLLFTLCMSWFLKFSLRMMDNAINNGNLPESKVADMERQRPNIEHMLANIVPVTIINIVGIALCFYGALRMRKLKKEGFYIYVLGEIAPIIAGAILLGVSSQYNGVMSYIMGAIIPVLFVVLYAVQLKHMDK
ncbi:MAG: hypothetical protein JST39_01565 [Bacteroidetes bacterium]|nr:hypothetical protein [Bacteroidota bacterium]